MALNTSQIDAIAKVDSVLGRLGFQPGSGNDAFGQQRLDSLLSMLSSLNRVFVDPNARELVQYDASVAGSIQNSFAKTLNETDKHGGTTRQKLQAMLKGDEASIEFLVKDIPNLGVGPANIRNYYRGKLQAIYDKHPGNPAAAVPEVLKLAMEQEKDKEDQPITTLMQRLEREGLKDHLAEAMQLLVSGQADELLSAVDALNDQGILTPASAAPSAPQPAPSGTVEPANPDVPPSESPAPPVPPPPAPMSKAEKYDQALKILRSSVGSQSTDATFSQTDAVVLKNALAQLQNDPNFGQGWTGNKTGVFSPEFLEHLKLKIQAMPEDTDQARTSKLGMQNFTASLDVFANQGTDVLTSADSMDPGEAIEKIELALSLFGERLNGVIAGEEAKLKSNLDAASEFNHKAVRAVLGGREWGGFWTKIIDQGIYSIMDGELGHFLDTRIGEVNLEDGVFDFNSQSSLQAFFVIMGNEQVMNIPSLKEGIYTPEAGQQILGKLDVLQNMLDKQIEKAETEAEKNELTEFKKGLTADKITQLIDALDCMYAHGLLSTQKLVNEGFSARISPEVSAIVRDFAKELDTGDPETSNPEALKLMDAMCREFAGRTNGLAAMGALNYDPLADDPADTPQARAERLQKYYNQAKAKFGDDEEAFDLLVKRMQERVMILPFNSNEERRKFDKAVRDALTQDALFGQNIVSAVDAMRPDGAQPRFRTPVASYDNIELDPRVREMTVTSGGQNISGEQLLNAYKNWNKMRTEDSGTYVHMDDQNPLVFTDDSGKLYIGVTDPATMIFTIEEVNRDKVAQLNAMFKNPDAVDANGRITQEAKDKMMEVVHSDPGLSLVVFGDDRTRFFGFGYNEVFEMLDTQTVSLTGGRYDFSEAPLEYQNKHVPETPAAAVEEAAKVDSVTPPFTRAVRREQVPEAELDHMPRHTHEELNDLEEMLFDLVRKPKVTSEVQDIELLRRFDDPSLQFHTALGREDRLTQIEISDKVGRGPNVIYYSPPTKDHPETGTIFVVSQSELLAPGPHAKLRVADGSLNISEISQMNIADIRRDIPKVAEILDIYAQRPAYQSWTGHQLVARIVPDLIQGATPATVNDAKLNTVFGNTAQQSQVPVATPDPQPHDAHTAQDPLTDIASDKPANPLR